ncbi:MAG: response regulator consisting of a CheY-like receiver domain and a Fis-type domain protein [Phycisphaerales bacterium]|jgi:DNA-binding response OmpR family regulator|nr:response regulator consisting of a CheY-like receiver domain and a Fis-type domain protein [Phycisphaerales bacterium]
MDTATNVCTLIVEDDADTCNWIGRLLSRHSYDFVCANTLAEAFERLQDGPACVILDLGLPDGNGVEILRHIRKNHLPIKVAVLTGNKDYSTIGTAILLKPDALLTKPVDASDLLNWMSADCC